MTGLDGPAPTALIVAKAPVAGFAKTRIAATVGAEAAAELAAAALLDTLAVAATLDWPRVVSMTGDLDQAARRDDIVTALGDFEVVEQRGDDFGRRLVNAHHDADRGNGVVQIGMDSPQVTRDDWLEAGRIVAGGCRALGLAADGGWWLLGAPAADQVDPVADVAMSQPRTGELTLDVLPQPVQCLRTLSDMDSWDDARTIAEQMPRSRLAATVARVSELQEDA